MSEANLNRFICQFSPKYATEHLQSMKCLPFPKEWDIQERLYI